MTSIPRKFCYICCDQRPVEEFVICVNGIYRLARECEFCRTMPSMPDGFKYCRGCIKLKPITDFLELNLREELGKIECADCRGILPDGFKRCSKCKNVKRFDEFHKDRTAKDGFNSQCKACQKQYRLDNSEYLLTQVKKWQKNNPGKISEYVKRYHKRHPEVAKRAYNRRLEQIGDCKISDVEIEEQYHSQNGLCWWCSKPIGDDYHIDHRIPLSRGGLHTIGNICISCPFCNLSKNNKMPWEWNGRLL